MKLLIFLFPYCALGFVAQSPSCRPYARPCAPVHSVQAAKAPTIEEWKGWSDADVDTFMRNYWQRKPLLIRQAFPGCSNGGTPLVSKEELLNLACAEDVESRIIQGFVAPPGGEARWQLSSGPFEEADFSRVFFGKVPWTLLVNEVNRHVPEASDLLQRFAFLPSWRIDDLMVSYAPRGGGVGPHVDSYDVFLLQVAGTRQWSIETQAISTEAEVERLVPGIDVRILKGFQEDHTWTLNPGDMLYLPPRVPHHGVSLDDECITYSVGFRAPSHREVGCLMGPILG
ncbi:unnamed protein product, partial [Phaeothamnion confervicola]